MKYIYNLIIRLLSLITFVFGIVNRKAKLRLAGTKQTIKFCKRQSNSFKNPIWIHAASVGEFEQAKPLIIKIKQFYPDAQILVTFFSASGYEANKNYKLADFIFYLPDDTTANATFFIEKIRPKMAIFIKYEFWYNYLKTLRSNQIPTFSVSAIFRPKHFVFKPYAKFIRSELKKLDAIFVQNTESLQLLKEQQFTNAFLSGDTRFDRVFEIAAQNPGISEIESFCENSKTIAFGSVWPNDMELIIKYINSSQLPNVKYIIVPHEIHANEIAEYRNKLTQASICFSSIKNLTTERILIIDTIGLLSKIYKYANLAYIGGGFGTGIHNILEAAVYGIPVMFGPKFSKFKEANDLIQLGGAHWVSNFEAFKDTSDKWLENSELNKHTGKIAADYVINNLGASNSIFNNEKFRSALYK